MKATYLRGPTGIKKIPFILLFLFKLLQGFFSYKDTHDITETAEYILRMCDKLNREKKKVSYYETKIKNQKNICFNFKFINH